MSDEELERLAAEMKNIKPSDAARKRGTDLAMEAFDAEFAAEKDFVNQENTSRQGSPVGKRQTDQTQGRSVMSKFKSIFNMPPRAYMMVGSCAAALMFAVVVIPPALQDAGEVQDFASIATEVEAASPAPEPQTKQRAAVVESDEIVVSGIRESVQSELKRVPSDVIDSIQASEIGDIPHQSIGESLESVPNVNVESIGENTVESGYTDSGRVSVKISQPDSIPSFEPQSRDRFEAYDLNPVTSVKETPVSTFSVDVDTASYSFLRASINRGQLPQPNSIRLEEMINYFPYDYKAPTSKSEPFNANVTVTPSPWNADTKLMHIGIKGYVPPAIEKPRSNIVLLIDTSGSMNAQNKLPLLISSFKLLLGTLDENDTVSIVTYAGSAGTVLEPTPATETGTIKRALNNLRAGGSTAGAAGLQLAYEKAQESFVEDGVNRVILATDGDFNVGFSSPDEMKRFIERKRKSGIFLSVLGFGQGNYNDALMQSLAQNGNGVAAYIDSLAEANKVLADEAGSALIPIAKDVKIQVEFNPATIAEYRLIGYETRALRREDFNNDKVDAGDINSGHTVTAIYELTPVGSPAVSVDDLRYAEAAPAPAPSPTPSLASASEELAFIKIRHKLPNSNTSTLQTFPIGLDHELTMRGAHNDTRFAAAVAAFGQKLRGDSQLVDYSYADIAEMASAAKGEDKHGYRAEFIQLVRIVDGLDE